MKRVLFYCFVALVTLWSVFPLYWAVNSSLKPGGEIFTATLWPANPTLAPYKTLLKEGFGQNILNSLLVATGTALLSLLLATGAAYALARLHFRGRGLLLLVMLGLSMLPQIAILSGMYEVVQALGLYGNHGSLVFSYLLFTLPFMVWVLTAFMKTVPKNLEEAAVLDGASTGTIITRVFLPLMAPALATTTLLSFIAAWNEFLFALTFLPDDSQRTVPVAIALFAGGSGQELPWNTLMAASVIVTVPILLLVFLFQKQITAGLTAGGLKG